MAGPKEGITVASDVRSPHATGRLRTSRLQQVRWPPCPSSLMCAQLRTLLPLLVVQLTMSSVAIDRVNCPSLDVSNNCDAEVIEVESDPEGWTAKAGTGLLQSEYHKQGLSAKSSRMFSHQTKSQGADETVCPMRAFSGQAPKAVLEAEDVQAVVRGILEKAAFASRSRASVHVSARTEDHQNFNFQ